MQNNSSNVTEKENSNSFWNNGLVIFFLAPIVFLFIVKFTGNQIFYGKDVSSKKEAKKVWLLSAGALFYLIILIIGLT